MQITQDILEELLDEGRGDGVGDFAPLSIEHLQMVINVQGYFSGVRYRYYPEQVDGQFVCWRVEERTFGS